MMDAYAVPNSKGWLGPGAYHRLQNHCFGAWADQCGGCPRCLKEQQAQGAGRKHAGHDPEDHPEERDQSRHPNR